jgi:hypothetical protein
MEQSTKQTRAPREAESRNVSYRPEAWRPPETLPSPDDRPGWSHRWVRLSTLGVADPGNISSKLREGYEPCKADEYPELMMHASTEGRSVASLMSLWHNVRHTTPNKTKLKWIRLTITF